MSSEHFISDRAIPNGVCGPECPECGCNATEIIQNPKPDTFFNSGKAACLNCGKVFLFSDLENLAPG